MAFLAYYLDGFNPAMILCYDIRKSIALKADVISLEEEEEEEGKPCLESKHNTSSSCLI